MTALEQLDKDLEELFGSYLGRMNDDGSAPDGLDHRAYAIGILNSVEDIHARVAFSTLCAMAMVYEELGISEDKQKAEARKFLSSIKEDFINLLDVNVSNAIRDGRLPEFRLEEEDTNARTRREILESLGETIN